MSVLTETCWNLPPAFPTANIDSISYGPIPLPLSPPSTSSPISSTSLTPPVTSAPTSYSNPSGSGSGSGRPNYKMPSPSSSLPNPKELSVEDDWTRVKDPKEKKRIQNRVAQRTYRHRMKARLGELQARLDTHERQRLHQAAQLGQEMAGGVSGVPIPFPSSTAAVNGHAGVSPAIGTCPADTTPSPIALDAAQSSHIPMLHQNMYEPPTQVSDRAMFSQGHHLSSPPQSHPSPPQAQNGMLSPPGRVDSEQSAKVSQDFVLDCLRFQSQLLTRLNTVQPEQGYQGQAAYGQAEAVPHLMDNMTSQEQLNCVGSFAQQAAGTEGVEFGFDGSSEAWRAASWAHKMRQQSSSADPLNLQHLADMQPTSLDPLAEHVAPTSMPATHHSLPVLPKATAMDEKFEGIMHHVQAAGFGSFDELAAAYYSSTFRDTSPLANEQHLSRNRRLPRVISDVYKAAGNWTHWERRGLHEEILKTAESMVNSEASAMSSSVMAQIGPMIELKDGMQHTPEMLQAMKKSLQHALPNSWALNMALANGKESTWPRDASNTALATTVLQQFSGKVPKEQLLQLIGACV